MKPPILAIALLSVSSSGFAAEEISPLTVFDNMSDDKLTEICEGGYATAYTDIQKIEVDFCLPPLTTIETNMCNMMVPTGRLSYRMTTEVLPGLHKRCARLGIELKLP